MNFLIIKIFVHLLPRVLLQRQKTKFPTYTKGEVILWFNKQ